MGLGDKTVHIVIGTKAQLIKMAPVMIELDRQEIGYNFIFTGQHKETINELMNVFGLREPDHYLYKGKDITKITEVPKWFLSSLWKLVKHNDKYGIKKNDIILVHGDTFSTVLGALVGKLSSCKVGHVESGLRSFNIFAPFPEELNRLITFGLSDYYFCPGKWAIDNLKGYKGIKINTEVNTLFDSLQLAKKNLNKVNIDIPANKYVLVSLHRFENIYNKKSLKKNIEIIEKVAEKFKVLFILHEPTKQNLNKFDFYERLQRNPNIELRPRYDYFRFINLVLYKLKSN